MNRFRLYERLLAEVEKRGKLNVVEAANLLGVHPNFVLQLFSELGTTRGIIYHRKTKTLYTVEQYKRYVEARASARRILDLISELSKVRKEGD